MCWFNRKLSLINLVTLCLTTLLPTFLLTEIPTDVNIFTLAKCLGTHKCGKVREECKRLLALPDEKGGCEKVRNHSSFLERYPWIKEGYETFNTRKDIFVVKKCEHYVSTSK